MGLLIGGLATGGVFALVGLGIVVIYRATGVVNFAQGQLLMLGAYAYVLTSQHFGSGIVQLVLTVAAGIAMGLVSYALVHLVLHRADEFVAALGTFGFGLLLEAFVRQIYTDNPKSARAWISGGATVHLGGSVVTVNALLTVAVAIVLTLALLAWFRFTMTGKAMEAVAEDSQAAALTGIRVRRMLIGSWVIGGVLAALGGLLTAPITGAYPAMGSSFLLPALFVIVIGGLDNVAGALVGGFVLGLLQTYTVAYISGAFRDVIIFAILLVVLLIRPNGLFGALAVRRF